MHDNLLLSVDSNVSYGEILKTVEIHGAMQWDSVDDLSANSGGSVNTSEMNRQKLQNIKNLVQKLRQLNSTHDEARTDRGRGGEEGGGWEQGRGAGGGGGEEEGWSESRGGRKGEREGGSVGVGCFNFFNF
ncbi:hypothetical protein Ancab_010441 [Ancistrocladus abbreviatus]